MTTATTIAGLMPLVKAAADVVAAFQGDAAAAVADTAIQGAADVIAAVAPLVDSFAQGYEVTPDDAREALEGMDDALAAFDAEIARQGGS